MFQNLYLKKELTTINNIKNKIKKQKSSIRRGDKMNGLSEYELN